MDFDVAVVGAGPAGSLAAARLAHSGARVALIDGSHPREKPCGGGVTGRALRLAARALAPADDGIGDEGIADGSVADDVALAALPAVRIARARFVDSTTGASASVALHRGEVGDGKAADAGHRRDRRREESSLSAEPLVVVSRTAFDAALYDAAARAGGELVRARARAIARSAAGWSVSLSSGAPLTASWLIGADGANSLVRRTVAQRFGRDQISIATGFFAHGVSGDEVVIEMVDDPPGYIWSFPRPDHLAIGICAQADAGIGVEALRTAVARWIGRTGIAAGAELVPYSWPIPSLTNRGFECTPLAGDRWLTTGDAAGLVDPITREGIFFALQSADLAANALIGTAVGAGDPSATYSRRVRAAIVDELAIAAALKAGFFRPRFTRLLVEGLQRSAAIRAVMSDLIAGAQPYRELKGRLLKTFEWKLAWQLFTARDSRRARGSAIPAASR